MSKFLLGYPKSSSSQIVDYLVVTLNTFNIWFSEECSLLEYHSSLYPQLRDPKSFSSQIVNYLAL